MTSASAVSDFQSDAHARLSALHPSACLTPSVWNPLDPAEDRFLRVSPREGLEVAHSDSCLVCKCLFHTYF